MNTGSYIGNINIGDNVSLFFRLIASLLGAVVT